MSVENSSVLDAGDYVGSREVYVEEGGLLAHFFYIGVL